MLGAESNDELLVGLLLASLVEDAHVGLAAVEGLGSLTETAGKTVVHEGQLQNTLEGVQNGHLALGASIGGNLDLLGHLGGVVLFYVRLQQLRNPSVSKSDPATTMERGREAPMKEARGGGSRSASPARRIVSNCPAPLN